MNKSNAENSGFKLICKSFWYTMSIYRGIFFLYFVYPITCLTLGFFSKESFSKGHLTTSSRTTSRFYCIYYWVWLLWKKVWNYMSDLRDFWSLI